MLNEINITTGTRRGSCSHRWHSATFIGGEGRNALMCLRFFSLTKKLIRNGI